MSSYLHNYFAHPYAKNTAFSFFKICAPGLVLALWLGSTSAGWSQKIWDGGGAMNNWNDAANWNPDGVPTALDNVTIALDSTITVDIPNAVCNSLQLGGAMANTMGILTFSTSGNPKLTVSGAVTVGGSGTTGNGRRGEIIFVSGATLIAGSIVLTQSTPGNDNPGRITMTSGSTLRTGSFAIGEGLATWMPGAGTVELSAPNTLPATTFTTFHNLSILSGTTTFGAAMTITGKLSISAAGKATLFAGTDSPVNNLTLGGVSQSNGTFGGTGSGATHINPTYFSTTTGIVTVGTDCSNAGLWTGVSSTDWSDASNWCGEVPTAATDVTIPNGANVTVNTAAVCASFTIEGGNAGNLVSINAPYSLTVTGAVTIGGGTTNNADDKYLDVNDGTLSCGSIFISDTGMGQRDSEVRLTSGTVNVSGNITMNGGPNRNAITFFGAGILNIAGSITGGDIAGFPGSTVNFNGAAPQTIPMNTAYVYGNLAINNPAGATFQAAVDTMRVAGNITVGNLVSGSVLHTNNVAMERGLSDTITVVAGSTFNAGTTPITWSDVNGVAIINGTFITADTFGLSGIVNAAISATNAPSILLGTNSTVEFSAVAPFIQLVTQRSDYANVKLTGGVKTMAGGTHTISGSLTINTAIYNGTTNNPVVNLAGDLLNSAFIFNQGNGRINLVGTALQTIGGTATPVYDTLVLNNSGAGAVLSSPVTIGKKFIFTRGILKTTSSNFLVFSDNATVSANDTSFVSGPVRKVGDDPFTFPVGKATTYGPIAITAPAVNTDAFQAEYFAAAPTGNLDMMGILAITDEEYWDLDRVGGASAVNVIMDFTGNSMANATDLNNLRVARFNESLMQWVSEGNTATSGTPTTQGTITSAAVSSFSFFTLGSSVALNALPIELAAFTATPEGKTVRLDWNTVSELNNAFFHIERSANGLDFSDIGKVAGAGTSRVPLVYTFTDQQPLSGWNYYRLRQEDTDGKYTHSPVQAVFMDKTDDKRGLLLFPNPAVTTLNLKTNHGVAADDRVEILDHTGYRVYYFSAFEAIKVPMDVSQLPAGMYIVRLQTAAGMVSASFVKL